MELISIRLDRKAVEELRGLARLEAVRRDEPVTWAALVREAIECRLAAERTGAPPCLAGAPRATAR